MAARDALRAADLERRGTRLPTREADESELGRVHGAGYLADLVHQVPGKSGWLDGDTYFSPGTWAAALAAAGGVIDATRVVLDGEHRRGLAIIRPPGHHAEADRAMGFCLLNNVAIAAAFARDHGASRVAIVDWDVHHGNGTQHIFERDPSVMFQSCHQYPFYPGTGDSAEVGVAEGVGATVNVPLPGGCGDREYSAVFDGVLIPELRRFAPDIILVSAGFDAHRADPLAGMRVTEQGFRAMADRLVSLADELCDGRVVCALEGGYDLAGLGASVVAVLDALTASPLAHGGANRSAESVANGGDGSDAVPEAIIDPERTGEPTVKISLEIDSRALAAIAQTRRALAAAREASAAQETTT